MAEVKLDWDMEPSERLEEEIKASDNQYVIKIGNHILKCFKTNDQLAKDYKDRKITLKKIQEHIVNNARTALGGKDGCIEDQTVYGWAKDYIQDVKTKASESPELILDVKTQEDLRKQAEEEFKKSEIRKMQEEAERVKKEKEIAEKEFQKKQKEKIALKKQKEKEKLEKIKKEGQISLW